MDLLRTKRIILLFTIFYTFISLISLVNTQLTQNDISVIQKNLLENQDEQTGLFNKSLPLSLKSLKILKNLNTKIKNEQKICRELSYETNNEINLSILELNNLLNCKHTFTNLDNYKQENFEKMNFNSLYESLLVNISAKMEVNWENVFELLINFQDEYLFFRNDKENKEDPSNLARTAKALKIFIHMANLPKNSPEFKGRVEGRIEAIWENLIKEFQILRKDVGYFFDNASNSLELNSEISDILSSMRNIVKIEDYNLLEMRMLNHYLIFNHHERNVENLSYYFNILKVRFKKVLFYLLFFVNFKLIYFILNF